MIGDEKVAVCAAAGCAAAPMAAAATAPNAKPLKDMVSSVFSVSPHYPSGRKLYDKNEHKLRPTGHRAFCCLDRVVYIRAVFVKPAVRIDFVTRF
jgi:hypothetical protein